MLLKAGGGEAVLALEAGEQAEMQLEEDDDDLDVNQVDAINPRLKQSQRCEHPRLEMGLTRECLAPLSFKIQVWNWQWGNRT